MILIWLAVAALLLAAIPTATFLANLPRFLWTTPDQGDRDGELKDDSIAVSVLIPARDEEDGIAGSVEAALSSEQVDVEVVVLDDHSTDATADIVSKIASDDDRVRCLTSQPLPAGWNGKQYACRQLAELASNERFVFIDADVRLKPAALHRLAARQDRTGVSLLSAFPHQQTGTLLEKLIIPLMHFILLGFLPISRMRISAHPAYAAGCGQLFMTNRGDYEAAGTHAAIASSRHDGLKLPRAYREAGLMTDVVDGTDLAECRMYTTAGQVIRGVLKNAVEGVANPKLIIPFSVVLLGSTLLPLITLVIALVGKEVLPAVLSAIALAVAHVPRAVAAAKFRQPMTGVILHTASVLLFVILQWTALISHGLGRQVAWRGRVESVNQETSTT